MILFRKGSEVNSSSSRSLKGLVANAMQQHRAVIDAVLIDSNMPRMNGPGIFHYYASSYNVKIFPLIY